MKGLVKALLVMLPSFVGSFIFSFLEIRRKNKAARLKVQYEVTQVEFDDLLCKMDIHGDVLIHSSISSIGKFSSGVTSVVDALITSVQSQNGTIIAPALPFNGFLLDHLKSLEFFDLTNAKNCMGAISNILMNKEGVQRSLHPSHSVVACGPKANIYVSNHHQCETPFGEGSPYHHLSESGGKILLLGVGLNSVTNFHVYEDMLSEYLPFNVYTNKAYIIPCSGNDFKGIVETRAHNPQLSAKRNCERVRSRLIKNDYIQTFPLGASEVSLLDAKGLTITLLEMLLDNESIYGPVTLNPEQKEKVKALLIKLGC